MVNIHTIDPQTLQKWLNQNEAVLIDVRESGEYNTECIQHAKNLPLSQVTIDVAHLPEHKDKKLVFHCQSGRRSMMACEALTKENAEFDVWNLEGGIAAWKTQNLPTKSGTLNLIPLERQVQIGIGAIIVFANVMGFTVSSSWFFLSLIAGLGLINAGVTGWCGFGILLSKMPWNKG